MEFVLHSNIILSSFPFYFPEFMPFDFSTDGFRELLCKFNYSRLLIIGEDGFDSVVYGFCSGKIKRHELREIERERRENDVTVENEFHL